MSSIGRNKALAKIHIAKKNILHDDDGLYRHIIRDISSGRTGSSGDLSGAELAALLRRFKEMGFKNTQNRNTQRLALIARARHLGQERLGADWIDRLCGIVKFVCGVDRIEWVRSTQDIKRILAIIEKIKDRPEPTTGNNEQKEMQHC